MDTNKTTKSKKKTSRILAPLLGASLIVLASLPRAYSAENSASVGVSSHHEEVYGRAGIDYLPITNNGKLSLEGEINYSGDNDLTKGKVGLVYRQSPEGQDGLGANVFGFDSAGNRYATLGGEYFTENNQFFGNFYVGDFNGGEGGLVRDLFYNQDRSASLRGKIGGYYFQGENNQGETQDSSGVMGGLEVKISLSENWRIIAEGNVYSDSAFTGDASGFISIQYGGLNNRRPVQNRYLIIPEGQKVSDPRDQDPRTDTRQDTRRNGETRNGDDGGNGNGQNGNGPNLDFGEGGNIGNN